MNITKEQFMLYEHVRQDGGFNMFSPGAFAATNLPKEIHMDILRNYAKYKRNFMGPKKCKTPI